MCVTHVTYCSKKKYIVDGVYVYYVYPRLLEHTECTNTLDYETSAEKALPKEFQWNGGYFPSRAIVLCFQIYSYVFEILHLDTTIALPFCLQYTLYVRSSTVT